MDENTWCMDLVGRHVAGAHEFFPLGYGDPAAGGNDRIEVRAELR